MIYVLLIDQRFDQYYQIIRGQGGEVALGLEYLGPVKL